MALIYNKRKRYVISECVSCDKGMIDKYNCICDYCKIIACNICGNKTSQIKYDENGYRSCRNKLMCIPQKWRTNSPRYSIQCGINLRIVMTVLASACRLLNINIHCAKIILSYYEKVKNSNNYISFIFEKFVFLRKNFFML
jgi:hypothetical protein